MRRACGLGAAMLAAACAGGGAAAPAPSRADAAPALSDSARVHYPAGACQTGELQVQLFDRASGEWRDHPEHARLAAGSCTRERAELLLNELRVRCVDPSGRLAPSEWVVGAGQRAPGLPDPCPP